MRKELLKIKEFEKLRRLDTPKKIQDFLDTIAINKEKDGETLTSPLLTLRRKKAHCLEGALLAALALKIHGKKPLLLDLRTHPRDYDHVVALFKQDGYWGAISKTNHAVLRYREPIYKTTRELALSYFHEYFDDRGRKNLREYSEPFDLDKWSAQNKKRDWIASEKNLWDLEKAIDRSPHKQILTKKQITELRRADQVEIKAGKITEW